MSDHHAIIDWARAGARFTDLRYSRAHRWRFDGGIEVPASASPSVVPPPLSVAEAVDPEEAFVASLASCHMLLFLYIAARRGLVVESYRDEAVGTLGKDEVGQLVMRRVVLRPHVTFGGTAPPSEADLEAMHHEAHAECFLARSVRCEIRCEPRA